MIDHSLPALLFIRACVILLQYAPLIEVSLFLPCLFLLFNPTNPIAPIACYPTLQIATYTLAGLLIVEAIYYTTYYRPHKRRLQQWADYPAPLSLAERHQLFERCIANVSDWNNYLRLWFMLEEKENSASYRPNEVDGDIVSQIKQDNIREFILWAFFDREEHSDGRSHDDEEVQLQEFISIVEHLLGHKFPPGRGEATALRLTIDKVRVRYRCAIWYGLIAIVDFATYLILRSHNFTHYNPSTSTTKENPTAAPMFPPRVQSLLHLPFPGAQYFRKQSSPSSPGSVIGYWSRPHRSKTHHPILFIHGIGIGLWPYKTFLAHINKDTDPSNQIGIIALEIMPMSARLTAPPLTQSVFLEQVAAILAAQGIDDGKENQNPWRSFVLVSHSYGSVLSTHVLHSPNLGPRVHGLVLIDPVSILLHLPDVAFNFTRRVPRTASEWQLWYFASTDMGIAEGLGRHFFWRENIIWKEELVRREVRKGEEGDGGVVNRNRNRGRNGNAKGKRKVAVSLSGRDLIVDTRSVARYLESDKDLKELAEDGSAVDAIFGETDCTRTSRSDPSLEILWFSQLDHAQVFDTSRDTGRIIDVVRRFCLKDAAE